MGKAKDDTAITEPKTGGALAIHDYGDDVGAGYEGTTNDDFSIPFLNVLQALSPEITGDGREKIEGAEAGNLYNTVTEELLKDGIEFVPSCREHVYVEWVPRVQGGGYVGRHSVDSEVVKAAKAGASNPNELVSESGNQLVETFYLYGVMVQGDLITPVVIAFTSTKIAVYKRFMTKVNQFTVNVGGKKQRPPLFAHLVRVGSTSQKNKHGSFFNFTLSPAEGDLEPSLLAPSDARFEAAKQLREAVSSGAARAAVESTEGGGGGATTTDVPF